MSDRSRMGTEPLVGNRLAVSRADARAVNRERIRSAAQRPRDAEKPGLLDLLRFQVRKIIGLASHDVDRDDFREAHLNLLTEER